MAERKKRASTKKSTRRASGDNLRLQIILAGVVLTVLSIVALVLTRGPVAEHTAVQGVEQVLDDISVEIESLLLRNGIALDQIDRYREPGLLRYEIRAPAPAAGAFDRLRSRLQKRFQLLDEQRRFENAEVTYYWQGALIVVLKFEPGELPPELPPPHQRPQLAIIMDDLGRSLSVARQLAELDLHVTFSILPGEPRAGAVASLARRLGQETMLHLPMEPHDYPQTNPGSDALLLGQSPEEIRQRLNAMLGKVPLVTGANNHMGSRFTEYAEGMEVVLQLMREKGLFFVDSRTSSRSVAARVAARTGVPVASRDMFLDNVADVEAIRAEIRKLVRLSQRQGAAIGICHPYPETLAALSQEQGLLKDGTVELVFASALVR